MPQPPVQESFRMDNLLQKALHIIKEKGWNHFELIHLVSDDVSAADVYQRFPNRFCVLEALGRHLDQLTLKNIETFDDKETQKDRLFSIFMTRVDVLTPYKQVIHVLWRDLWKDPLVALSSVPQGINSVTWILQAAGLDTTGILGALRVKAFAVCYLATIYAWLQDDSQDLDVTMEALDSNLRRLEMLPQFYITE